MKGRKQAYLILAHGHFEILEQLCLALDSAQVDIYIHLDAAVASFDFAHFENLCRLSRVRFVARLPIYWGGENLILATLNLFRAAFEAPEDYAYFHLISGVDFLLQPIEKISEFFAGAYPQNFLRFEPVPKKLSMGKLFNYRPARPSNRINFYYPQHIKSRKLFKFCSDVAAVLQKVARVRRFQSDWDLYYGSQWMSLTDVAVSFLLDHQAAIERLIWRTYAIDEVIFQTFLANQADLKKTLNFDFKRLIDWDRGHPYSFGQADLAELLQKRADYFFVRKVEDLALVKQLRQAILAEEGQMRKEI